MYLIDKIFGSFKATVSLICKGNNKEIVKQSNGQLQISQAKQGVINILNIDKLTIDSIERLAGVENIESPKDLLQSAGMRFIVEQNTKQKNFKTIVEKAKLNEIEKPQTLEQDWFLRWMSISETVGKEDVQNILAKILSREVEKSNTFSLRTLDVLKNITKRELSIFQKFCDISFRIPELGDIFTCVICDPFGTPGNNALSKFGLYYEALTILQDAGLIKTDLNSWRELSPLLLGMQFTLGNTVFNLKNKTTKTEPNESMIRFHILNFTSAGIELRSVITLNSNEEYNTELIEWLENKLT